MTDPTTPSLSISADATDEEAAAVAAAISAYLSERERAAADAATERTWDGSRWTFAGRLDAVSGRSGRVPTDAPRDPWTASARADRF